MTAHDGIVERLGRREVCVCGDGSTKVACPLCATKRRAAKVIRILEAKITALQTRIRRPFEATPETIERFWAQVDKNGPNGCWLWTGALDRCGYSAFFSRGARIGHRVAWQLTNGPIPDGMCLDHLCRVRACVNPDHLQPVSAKENTLRGNTPAGNNAKKTHCIRGHEFTPENTIIRKSYTTKGRNGVARQCRTCLKSRYQRAREKQQHV